MPFFYQFKKNGIDCFNNVNIEGIGILKEDCLQILGFNQNFQIV